MFSICKGRSGISEVSLISSSLLEILSEFHNLNLPRILLKTMLVYCAFPGRKSFTLQVLVMQLEASDKIGILCNGWTSC